MVGTGSNLGILLFNSGKKGEEMQKIIEVLEDIFCAMFHLPFKKRKHLRNVKMNIKKRPPSK